MNSIRFTIEDSAFIESIFEDLDPAKDETFLSFKPGLTRDEWHSMVEWCRKDLRTTLKYAVLARVLIKTLGEIGIDLTANEAWAFVVESKSVVAVVEQRNPDIPDDIAVRSQITGRITRPVEIPPIPELGYAGGTGTGFPIEDASHALEETAKARVFGTFDKMLDQLLS